MHYLYHPAVTPAAVEAKLLFDPIRIRHLLRLSHAQKLHLRPYLPQIVSNVGLSAAASLLRARLSYSLHLYHQTALLAQDRRTRPWELQAD